MTTFNQLFMSDEYKRIELATALIRSCKDWMPEVDVRIAAKTLGLDSVDINDFDSCLDVQRQWFAYCVAEQVKEMERYLD